MMIKGRITVDVSNSQYLRCFFQRQGTGRWSKTLKIIENQFENMRKMQDAAAFITHISQKGGFHVIGG